MRETALHVDVLAQTESVFALTVINVTNGKLMRLLIDDEPFDVRYGEVHAHERLLDFRAGTLSRQASPRRVRSRRHQPAANPPNHQAALRRAD
ncbi:MAG TPA: hypothetical protein VEZ15_12790, partial [Acidimicrobiia bacterium]|nr:hypothetical protein [Acidimicrobiia bacterium]